MTAVGIFSDLLGASWWGWRPALKPGNVQLQEGFELLGTSVVRGSMDRYWRNHQRHQTEERNHQQVRQAFALFHHESIGWESWPGLEFI